MIEDNRITFLGDKVAHGFGSKVGAFLMSRDVAATGMAVAFAVVAAELVAPGGSAALMAAGSASVFGVGSTLLARRVERNAILGEMFPDKIVRTKMINKKPDNAQISDSDVQFSAWAKDVKNVYVLGLVMAEGTLLPLCGWTFVKAMNVLPVVPYAVGALVASGIIGARFVSGIRRWGKVEAYEWRVDDNKPPLEPVRSPDQASTAAAASVRAPAACVPV